MNANKSSSINFCGGTHRSFRCLNLYKNVAFASVKAQIILFFILGGCKNLRPAVVIMQLEKRGEIRFAQ